MCLVEDGLIGLNRPFIEYVSELDVSGVQWLEEARVADLLCHTSGLDDMTVAAHIAAAEKRGGELPVAAPGQHPALAKRIHLAAGVKLLRQPGTAMLYSNFGFNLLGDIVRRVSGLPLGEFARRRLFDKIGMPDTYFILPTELRDRRVFRRPGDPGTQAIPGVHSGTNSPEYDALDWGALAMKSTAADLAAFLQMFLDRGRAAGGRVLSSASVEAMLRQQVDASIPCLFPYIDPASGQRREYEFAGSSYGWGVFLSGVRDRYLHNGSTASLSAFGHSGYGGSYMWADPRHDIVGVLLSTSARMYRHTLDPDMNSDLFMNAAYAALTD
jgi:CubicO group peptidase (beta-lactamase class C family)